MTRAELPSFDLVVATVDREEELDRLLSSLAAQTHRAFRVVLVDQNGDDRLDRVVAAHPALEVVRLRAARGLSRARNAGLERVSADVVAFPDDDCVYPPDLLERVAARLAGDPALDGLTGRPIDKTGTSPPTWNDEPAMLTDDNLWNRVVSFAIFLRRATVTAVGTFDEALGLGSGTTWCSGEEVDYLVRAVRGGARIVYDPGLVVGHPAKPPAADGLGALGFRDGASIGYILRKHRYPPRVVVRMLVRPAGGTLVSLLRLRPDRARFHAATLRGRIRGLRAGRG